jgi:hypothetical protein
LPTGNLNEMEMEDIDFKYLNLKHDHEYFRENFGA